jgi:hypothetical protein
MNPRIILYAIAGGLCVFMGIGMIQQGDYIWGGALLIIGILNGIQMFRLAMLPEN